MSTTKQAVIAQKQTRPVSIGVDGWFNKQVASFEAGRFGWMAIYITLQSCLGSIACMYILQNKASDIMLALCAVITMTCNAILIAQAPGKWCLLSFYLSMVLNTLFILLNV